MRAPRTISGSIPSRSATPEHTPASQRSSVLRRTPKPRRVSNMPSSPDREAAGGAGVGSAMAPMLAAAGDR